jgi:thiol-disulfide isomerase/thioredoxin
MAMKIGTDLPTLAGATEWINGAASREILLGTPLLVHFWAISCGICSEQMPQVNKWREQNVPRGMKVVGIHMPRSEADTNIQRVQEAVHDYGLTHPIAVDNTHAITDLFENQYVPAFYLFDGEGHLRHYSAGEHGLGMLEKAMERVLAKAAEGTEATG